MTSMSTERTSVAHLLDQARQQLVEARERGENPRYLRVNTDLYEVVAEAKAREVFRGSTLLLLGLEVVGSDSVPAETPEVC